MGLICKKIEQHHIISHVFPGLHAVANTGAIASPYGTLNCGFGSQSNQRNTASSHLHCTLRHVHRGIQTLMLCFCCRFSSNERDILTAVFSSCHYRCNELELLTGVCLSCRNTFSAPSLSPMDAYAEHKEQYVMMSLCKKQRISLFAGDCSRILKMDRSGIGQSILYRYRTRL